MELFPENSGERNFQLSSLTAGIAIINTNKSKQRAAAVRVVVAVLVSQAN